MSVLKQMSTIAGVMGALLCVAAVLFSLNGSFYVAGLEALTLFNGGIAAMVFACLVKIDAIQRSLDKD